MDTIKPLVENVLKEIKDAGLYKDERIITSPQSAAINVKEGEVINFCANNYLGLANNPEIANAAIEGIKKWGYGLSSVRFICGTQEQHKILENKISGFLGTDDTILYSSCFDANAGLFETLLTKEDAIISDSLNHASIIDGVRLCKAERKVFEHGNMDELKKALVETKDLRTRMIATDGVFSMDGDIAKLPEICELAEEHDALVMVDDSHSTGFFGPTGRGTAEHHNVMDKIDITTSTLGKAMGGASGGFTSGRGEIIELLRQRSRPYLFSNSLAPPIVAASIKVLDLVEGSAELRDKLNSNTKYFREKISELGFEIRPGIHPIVPIMLGDAKLAKDMASDMLAEGIYVIGFSYPVVPKGAARIRVQISAGHSQEHLDKAISAFEKVGKKHSVI